MEDVKIILSALWISTLFAYAYGDILRIMSGDAERMMAGEIQFTPNVWLLISVMMVIPIIMIIVSLTMQNPVNRWANIIAAIFWFGLNLFSLNTYPGAYDKFLLIVSMGFNLLTIWYAWHWV